MKELEVTPLKDKKLIVLTIEKEYDEPFWLFENSPKQPSRAVRILSRPSVAFYSFLEKLIREVKPDFITEELGMRSSKEFHEDNVLAKLFEKNNIPYWPADIDENARAYLALQGDEKRLLSKRIIKALDEMSARRGENEESSVEEEYLVAYGQYLQSELQQQEHEAEFSIRESWIAMGILDNARRVNGKEEITSFHISSPKHVNGVKNLLESLDVKVEVLKLSKEVTLAHSESFDSKEIEDLLQSMRIKIKPTIKTAAEDSPHLLFFLDTDRIASPFDVCMAYDAGFNAVIPYGNVNLEDAKRIVQDAMFSRGPKGVKHTCFFIGGKDYVKAEEISNAIRNIMFPPFETSIIVDPAGGYTTAAATVAKVEQSLIFNNLGNIKDKTCAVFGTGAVGRIMAVLLTRLGCEVMIVSLNPKRTNGEKYAAEVAESLRERFGANAQGVFAPTSDKKIEVLKKAEVIFCAGTEGVRVIEKSLLQELKLLKVIADINAVPPLGLEGIKLNDDMREIMPGIFGIGALTIGRLKHNIEKEMLRQVRGNGKGTYNYTFAFELARKTLLAEARIANLALTINFPSKLKDAKS
jgi:methylene-tetrahydromethanopterin dehydrogenase